MASSPPLRIDDDDDDDQDQDHHGMALSDLSLLTSPAALGPLVAVNGSQRRPTSTVTSTARASLGSGLLPATKPPLAGRPSSLAQRSAGKAAEQAQMRFLQGVNKPSGSTAPLPSSSTAAHRTAAAGVKRRMSLFAPMAVPHSTEEGLTGVSRPQEEEADEDELEEDPDDSLRKALILSSQSHDAAKTSAALPSIAAGGVHPARGMMAEDGIEPGQTESKEQMQRQLEEVTRMRETFEAYERMLEGTAGQLELFSDRLHSTSSLLSSYIDLLLRSSSHQSLLTNPSWQGQTVDQSRHEEAMRDLELELERRRRQREKDEEEEKGKGDLEREKARSKGAATPRGRGGGAAPTASGRGRPITARGAAPASRGARTAAGPPSAAASSRSTGVLPGRGAATATTGRSTSSVSRPSGIPAPSSTRGSHPGVARGR